MVEIFGSGSGWQLLFTHFSRKSFEVYRHQQPVRVLVERHELFC